MAVHLRVRVDDQVANFVGTGQGRRSHLIDDVPHDQFRGHVSATMTSGAIGDHAAQALVAVPVSAGVLVVGAPALVRQDGQLDLLGLVVVPRSLLRTNRLLVIGRQCSRFLVEMESLRNATLQVSLPE